MVRSGVVVASVALAASSNAFIIPSTISVPHVRGDGLSSLANKLSGAAHIVSGERLVKLGCPGCSIEGKEEGTENDMVLKWSLSDDRKVLRLNDEDFFGKQEDMESHQIGISQVPSATSLDTIHSDLSSVASPPRPLSYRARYRHTPAADGTQDELIDLDFGVNRLGKEQVHGADSLSLRLLKDEEGRLAISDIVTVPADNSKAPKEDNQPPAPSAEQDKTFTILPISPMIKNAPNGAAACQGHTEAFCRFMDAFKAKVARIHNAIQAAKAAHAPKVGGSARHPCHGRTGRKMQIAHHGPPGTHQGPPGIHLKGGVQKFKIWIFRFGRKHTEQAEAPHEEKAQIEALPAHEDHPHHHAHLHGLHRVSHVAYNVFFGFFIPVLIGIAAGMTASLLGMVVGTGIAMLWFKIRRGGRRGNASERTVESTTGEVALGDEKVGLTESERDSAEYEEAPPTYKDEA